MEERSWKPFRNALDKSERKDFDAMFAIPRLYLSACSYSTQVVRLYPILISILLHCYKLLTDSVEQVKRLLCRTGEGEICNEPISR